MRIAMIGQKGIPAHYGGVERHVHDLSVGLTKTGHEVTVYGRKWYTKTNEKIIDGVKLVHTPTIHTKYFDAITHTFISTIHALFSNFDIIHYHGVGPSLLSWIPRILSPDIKVITTFHSIDRYHQKWGKIAKFFLKLGERFACTFPHETITVSKSLEQYCYHEYHKKTVYIPNGVVIKKIPESTDVLKQFELEKNKYIVMVSRLVPHKGAHTLIDAFHKLKIENPNNTTIQELKLAIVGGSACTDEYIKQLHTQASSMNDVVFTDFQSGEILAQLYAHAKVLVHPSFAEGLPITVLEAMGYARPVLLSAIPEHLEIVDDTRIFFKVQDISSLEEKLLNFLTMSQEEQNNIGSKNKKIVEEKYKWDKLVGEITSLYQQPTPKHSSQIGYTKEIPV